MAQKNFVHHNAMDGHSAADAASARKKTPFAAILAAIAVIGVLAGFAITKFKSGTDPVENVDTPTVPEVVPNQLTAPEAPPEVPTETTQAVSVATPLPAQVADTVQPVAAQQRARNNDAGVETGTDPETTEEEDEEKPKRRSPYKSRTEALLSMLNSVPPGMAPPPLPFSIDDDLEADADIGAENVIEITEDDDEATATLKENVGWDKLDLQEMRKEGWTAAEFIKALEAERNEDAVFRREKMQELERMLNDPEASDDDCYALYDELNKELAERGLPKLYMPVEGDDEDEDEEAEGDVESAPAEKR